MSVMIELRNVTKTFHAKDQELHAIQSVNLTIQSGEIFGIIGRSGAGKSTLVRCMNLLERPTKGHVLIEDQDLMTLSPKELRQARHRIGMVFQHFNLLSTRTVFQNVAFPLELLKRDRDAIHAKVTQLLTLVGLSDKAHHYPSQLSGGQKQRVAIARALATDPAILLCDEMTSALDPETTLSILELIDDINEKLGVTIVLITHEMEVIKEIADRVAVLENGYIVEEANVFELFKAPQSEAAKKLLTKALKLELPNHLKEKIREYPVNGDHPVLRIRFFGDIASKPVIDDLIKHFNVEVNILQGNLEYLHSDMMGILVISITANADVLLQVKNYLRERNIVVESVGYLSH